MILPRRKFITGLTALIASPAIVKASALMPIRGMPLSGVSMKLFTDYNMNLNISTIDILYGELKIRPEWYINYVTIYET